MNIAELKEFVERQRADAMTPEDRVLAAKKLGALREDLKNRLSAMPIGKRMAFWKELAKNDSEWLKSFLFEEESRWRRFFLCFLLPSVICLGGIALLAAWAISGTFEDAWPWMIATMAMFGLNGTIWFFCVRPKCDICGKIHWFGVCEDEYPDKAAKNMERRTSAMMVLTWMTSIAVATPWMTLRPGDAGKVFLSGMAFIVIVSVVGFFIRRKRSTSDMAPPPVHP